MVWVAPALFNTKALHAPFDPPDPFETITFRMDQQRPKPKDQEPVIALRNRVDEVINGKRKLTKTMKSASSPCFTCARSYKNEGCQCVSCATRM